jgi:hypothetical protein
VVTMDESSMTHLLQLGCNNDIIPLATCCWMGCDRILCFLESIHCSTAVYQFL